MRYLFLLLFTLTASAAPFGVGDPALLQSASPLRRGLVGYWRLEEATGTRYDSSQYRNHLTANNSPTNAVGKVGNAGSFVAASSQWLSSGSSILNNFDSTNSWTVMAWVAPLTNGTYLTIQSHYTNSPTYDGWYLAVATNKAYFVIESGNGANTVGRYSSSTLTSGSWYHLAVTYDGTLLTNGIVVYVNGISDSGYGVKAGGTPSINNNGIFQIGARGSSAFRNFFNGTIDECATYGMVLSSSEIASIYNSGLARRFGFMNTP